MDLQTLKNSLQSATPPPGLRTEIEALWWDAHGDWRRAHDLVDELENPAAMAVHAYLHRKEGDAGNADYWYRRSGRQYYRASLQEEWQALAEGLLAAE